MFSNIVRWYDQAHRPSMPKPANKQAPSQMMPWPGARCVATLSFEHSKGAQIQNPAPTVRGQAALASEPLCAGEERIPMAQSDRKKRPNWLRPAI
jgi:hypothetical protein